MHFICVYRDREVCVYDRLNVKQVYVSIIYTIYQMVNFYFSIFSTVPGYTLGWVDNFFMYVML